MKRNPWVAAAFGALAGVLLCASARASLVIVIPNYTFDDPSLADNTFTDSEVDLDPVPGWLFTAIADDDEGFPTDGNVISTGVWNPVNGDYPGSTGIAGPLPGAAHGAQAAYIFLSQIQDSDVVPLIGSLTTSDAVTTVASNTRYDLAVAVGNALGSDPGLVRIEILVNDVPVASGVADAGTLTNGTFSNITASFTTVVNDPKEGDDLRIRLLHTFDGVGPKEVTFDHVRLDATEIPEPASAAMLALCAGTLAARRRRNA